MMKIIKYKVFENNDDFVEWQLKGIDIINVLPITQNIGVYINDNTNADCMAGYGVFVLYREELENE